LAKYFKKISSKRVTCRTAFLPPESFSKLHEEIKIYKRQQGFMDYMLVPVSLFGLGYYNCVSWQRELLSKIEINVGYVVSPDTGFVDWGLKIIKWIIPAVIIVATIIYIFYKLY
jgi:hypothetical protein